MNPRLLGALWVVLLIVVVVGVDVLFLRGSSHVWERLIVNVVLVAVFGGVYVKFIRRP